MTIHFLAVPVGRPSSVPALIKHAIRFCRKLRVRGINFEAPSTLDGARHVCKITVGKRVVNIFDDGSHTRSLMLSSSWLRPQGGFDQEAFRAQSTRMHTLYLENAAHARRCGMKYAARADLEVAAQERLHHERAC